MSTCNRLDLESHGSWPTMPQKLPWHWNKPSTLTFYQLWRKLWERYSPQTRIIETYHKQKHEIHLSLCILTMSWQESSDFMSCNANFLGTGTNLLHSHSLNFEGSYEKDTLLRRGGSKLITNESTKSISHFAFWHRLDRNQVILCPAMQTSLALEQTFYTHILSTSKEVMRKILSSDEEDQNLSQTKARNPSHFAFWHRLDRNQVILCPAMQPVVAEEIDRCSLAFPSWEAERKVLINSQVVAQFSELPPPQGTIGSLPCHPAAQNCKPSLNKRLVAWSLP